MIFFRQIECVCRQSLGSLVFSGENVEPRGMELGEDQVEWIVPVSSAHHLIQSLARKVSSTERPCTKTPVSERRYTGGAPKTWIIEKLAASCEILFGAYEVAAPITHYHLKHIPKRQ